MSRPDARAPAHPGTSGNRWSSPMEQHLHSDDPLEAKRYWARCSNTHLASEEYYDRQKALVRELASRFLVPSDVIADFGCGSGFFTLELASFCREIAGYD